MSNFTLAGNSKEAQVYNAVVNHDVAKFREALSDGFDPEYVFHFGHRALNQFSLLMHAVRSKFREGIEILLREMNIVTCTGFAEACVEKDEEVIRVFLQIACERRRCSTEYLLILLRHKVVDMALEFIQMDDFNVDAQSILDDLQSPLHISARFQEPQLLECLIERGAKLDILDRNGLTPLHVACKNGSYQCCQCLLRHGAIPNFNNTRGRYSFESLLSPLFVLCQSLFPSKKVVEDIVELLLSAGLDMNKERWTLDRHVRHNVTDDTLHMLQSLCRVPSTLEIICVRAIRQHLVKLTTGRSIHSRVHELSLPLILKAQLIVSDVDQYPTA